jgi:hypothetical protein
LANIYANILKQGICPGELSEEDLLVVCQSFVDLGASLVRMAGDYIDVKDDDTWLISPGKGKIGQI